MSGPNEITYDPDLLAFQINGARVNVEELKDVSLMREPKLTKLTLRTRSTKVTPSSTYRDARGDLSVFDFDVLLDGEPLRSVKRIEITLDAACALPVVKLTCFDRVIDAVLEDYEGVEFPAEVVVELLRLGPYGESHVKASS